MWGKIQPGIFVVICLYAMKRQNPTFRDVGGVPHPGFEYWVFEKSHSHRDILPC
jgi:hypothetical protein